MEIRNNSNTSFQARVSTQAKNYLKNEAVNAGGKTMRALRNKFAEFSSIKSDVTIDLGYLDRKNGTISFGDPVELILTHDNAKLADEVSLPHNENSLLKSFMALTKKDVETASEELNASISKRANSSSGFDMFA